MDEVTPPSRPALEAEPTATPGPVPTQAPVRSTAGRSLRYAAVFGLAALLGTFLFIGGYLAAGSSGSCAVPSDAFAAFCEAYDKLHEQYVDELDDSKLVEGALKGLFQYGVEDPHSGYMNAEEYQNSLGDLSGTFSGIGAELAVENTANPEDQGACPTLSDTCLLVVVTPFDGSPAEEAGLQGGDAILAVDGESVNGSTIDEQVSKVRGPEGTDVTLTVRRGEDEFELTITRAEIIVVEVESELLNNHIGYIALHNFSVNASEQFSESLGDLLDQGADQIVFDLRNNPGGYITAAQEVASEFVDQGLLFTQESAGDEVIDWEATGDGQATDPAIEVAVLINGGSASASEIVAAALKETGRATIIGQPSFGKNTVQIWDELVNGGGVRITISRWFTPDHNSVAPDGVQPDIVVEVPEGTPADEDPVLDRALEFLATADQDAAVLPSLQGLVQRIGMGVVGWAPETGLWAAWRAC